MCFSTPPRPTSLPPNKPLPPLPRKPLTRLSERPESPTPYSSQNCRCRRDSDTLPPNSHQLKNLAINHYRHIEVHPARGSVPAKVQYWISADDVLNDRLKETKVPAGHWPKLVQLAKDVCGERSVNPQKEVRILTAFYSPDEEMNVEMKVESNPPNSE
ncbi:hypothetical protein TrVGV298_000688 [Trichoderma virens]|nr:hypothetical protein TrVGV298_000688 [Trichoderma virens]